MPVVNGSRFPRGVSSAPQRAAVAQLAHAQLSRAAWAFVVSTRTPDGGDPDIRLCEALDLLRQTLHASAVFCRREPPGSSGDWCTGHCQHATRKET